MRARCWRSISNRPASAASRSLQQGTPIAGAREAVQFVRHFVRGLRRRSLASAYEKDGRLSDRIGFDPAREAVTARSGTEAMALCTVLYAPKDTAAVLETKPGTREEIAAMEPLGPVLANA